MQGEGDGVFAAQYAQYGILSPKRQPQTIPLYVDKNPAPVAGVPEIDDPRHQDDSPFPWLRYFFPKDFDVREGSAQHPAYFHYFDVVHSPLQEDAAVVPPPWAPNAYFRLSFTQHHHHKHLQHGEPMDVAGGGRMPDLSSPLDAIDLKAADLALFQEGAEAHLEAVLAFCRSVATFQARTWKDAVPLVDLLRGVLLYLLKEYVRGQQLAREYATRDAMRAVGQERDGLNAEHAAALAAAKAEWDAETERRLSTAKETMRKQLAEEFAQQMRALAEDRDKWAKKANTAEASIKALNETVTTLEREVASLEGQIAADKAAAAKSLADKEANIRALTRQLAEMQAAVAGARGTLVESLEASTRSDLMRVVMKAIHSTLPGSRAYIAELTTRADVQGARSGLHSLQKLAEEEGAGGPLSRALEGLEPEYLRGPLAPGAAVSLEEGLQPRDWARELTRLDTLTPEAMNAQLCLSYTHATPDQAFMKGKRLDWDTGVTWDLVRGQSQVYIEDVASHEGVHLFQDHAEASGSYLALPLTGHKGEVIGVLGLDTLTTPMSARGGDPVSLSEQDVAFACDLVAVLSRRIAKDQQRFEELMRMLEKPAEVGDDEGDDYTGPVDPEPYADMSGGLAMFKAALEILKGLSDTDISAFASLEAPDDATLAVLRAVLSAAGQAVGADWASLRSLITRDLINRLAGLDPMAAWAEWQSLCAATRPLFKVEEECGRLDGLLAPGLGGEGERDIATPDRTEGGLPSSSSAGGAAGGEPGGGAGGDSSGAGLRSTKLGAALGRWIGAVRKISAANALKAIMEAKLKKANDALEKVFADGSNALQELRSYRVPPKITFLVLQAVLSLSGYGDDDTHNWGRMRVLTNFKLIKRLTELKPGETPKKLLKAARRVTTDVDESDVRKESKATLALFQWLTNFTNFGELVV